MILDAIASLQDDGYSFAHFAWSHAPSGDFGTWAEDSAVEFSADGGITEQAMTGWVDYFTRDDSGDPQKDIQKAMTAAGVTWHLDTVQYENDTGYIHYTWAYYESGE